MVRAPGASSCSITVPGVRNELAVCLTVTVIAALVGVRRDLHLDQRRPGLRDAGARASRSTSSRSSVVTSGPASALAIVLMLLVLVTILPIQRLVRESDS